MSSYGEKKSTDALKTGRYWRTEVERKRPNRPAAAITASVTRFAILKSQSLKRTSTCSFHRGSPLVCPKIVTSSIVMPYYPRSFVSSAFTRMTVNSGSRFRAKHSLSATHSRNFKCLNLCRSLPAIPRSNCATLALDSDTLRTQLKCSSSNPNRPGA